ncbi:hypothetical protein RVX_R18080 [Nitratidesulfovibrio sp. HK-II]|uniref:hypothetical protein n=1 Tax=Nitratidesulfovibrio sp. HK-II TaxID=2009266 RepID=UPI0011C076FC|nr:hypothetical protein [Nitratidesulfovibrio sp. HK-II]
MDVKRFSKCVRKPAVLLRWARCWFKPYLLSSWNRVKAARGVDERVFFYVNTRKYCLATVMVQVAVVAIVFFVVLCMVWSKSPLKPVFDVSISLCAGYIASYFFFRIITCDEYARHEHVCIVAFGFFLYTRHCLIKTKEFLEKVKDHDMSSVDAVIVFELQGRLHSVHEYSDFCRNAFHFVDKEAHRVFESIVHAFGDVKIEKADRQCIKEISRLSYNVDKAFKQMETLFYDGKLVMYNIEMMSKDFIARDRAMKNYAPTAK